MENKKEKKEPGIVYPPDFDQTKAEPEKQPDPEQKSETPAVQQTQAVVINRSQIKTWQDALKALPTGLAQTPLNEKRIQIEVGFAAQLIRKNPQLQKCNPVTIFDSVVFAARIGMTLNPALGLSHLVPYGTDCTFSIDYKGWVAIFRDAGLIKDVNTQLVFNDEIFHRDPASGTIVHTPVDAESEEAHMKRKLLGGYNIFIFPDGSQSVPEWIPAWELDKIAKVSPAANSQYGPRKKWRDEMHKKSIIKRHGKKFRSLQNDERIEAMFQHEKEQDERNNKRTQIADDWDIQTPEEVV